MNKKEEKIKYSLEELLEIRKKIGSRKSLNIGEMDKSNYKWIDQSSFCGKNNKTIWLFITNKIQLITENENPMIYWIFLLQF